MTFIKDLTGPGRTDGPMAMVGADLGIARRDPRRGNLPVLMFGDNFSEPKLTGEWRSPSVLMYNEQLDPLGVPVLDHEGKPTIDPAGRVRQLWPYEHANPVFSTVLPTDFIWLGDRWWVHVMVMDKRGLDHGAVWTEWQSSTDLVNWSWEIKTQPPIPRMTMLTFDASGGWVYIFGTHGLSRDGNVYLWRLPESQFPEAIWQPWTGTKWGGTGEPAPILQGAYGELCYRATEFGHVLSYFDAANYRVAARVAPSPELLGRGRQTVIAEGLEYPQLYGGYWNPMSKSLDKAQFIVSQWRTADNSVYKSSLHEVSLKQRSAGWWPWALI